MDPFTALRAFIRVVETGSFSAVARELNVAQPTISKQVAGLEAQLGAQLLRRNSRQLSLTEAGQDYYESARRALEEIDAAQARIGRQQLSPAGVLRLTVPLAFGRIHILPLFVEFARLHPEMRFDVRVSSRFADLVEEGLDLAIRIGQLPDSSLVARRIGWSRRRTVAAASYFARVGVPKHPDDLAKHNCIAFVSQGAAAPWHFMNGEARCEIQPNGWLSTDDAEHIRAAAAMGEGVAHAPAWIFWDLLAQGEVVSALDDWRPPAEPIHAVYSAARRPAMKVRLFVDFLIERLTDPEIHSNKE